MAYQLTKDQALEKLDKLAVAIQRDKLEADAFERAAKIMNIKHHNNADELDAIRAGINKADIGKTEKVWINFTARTVNGED